MKIALASEPIKNGDIDFNLRSITGCMKKCSKKADLVLFGESVLQGFDALCWDYEKDKQMAVELSDARILEIRECAKECGLAVSFGFIERVKDSLYSTQIFIGKDGEIVNVFHRVSVGWKEYTMTDEHYVEGSSFEKFRYEGKSFAIGLCGDLWTDGRPEEMKRLGADIVLWPVWCNYKADEWESTVKGEYAVQAGLCGDNVLLVNPCCVDTEEIDTGGAVYFKDGAVIEELPFNQRGCIIVEV